MGVIKGYQGGFRTRVFWNVFSLKALMTNLLIKGCEFCESMSTGLTEFVSTEYFVVVYEDDINLQSVLWYLMGWIYAIQWYIDLYVYKSLHIILFVPIRKINRNWIL